MIQVWLDRVKGPLAGVGAAALVFAVGYFLVKAEFDWPMRILVILGVLGLGTAISIDPGVVRDLLGTRAARYGSNTLLMAVAFVGILGLINYAGTKSPQRWDLTGNKRYSISDLTVKVLGQLKEPVTVLAFMAPPGGGPQDEPAANAESLLKQYVAASNGRLQYRFVDPTLDPSTVREMAIKQYGAVVFQSGGKREDTTGTDESDFTGALIKLTQAGQQTVYFSTGHGEKSVSDNGPDGLSQLKQQLEKEGYKTEQISLATAAQVPKEAAALVLAAPTSALLDEEAKRVEEFLNQGGHLLIMFGPRSQAKLDELVKKWGIELGQGFVVDPASSRAPDVRNIVIQTYGYHSITKDFQTISLLPFSTNIVVPREPPKGTTITPLMQTSDKSWVEMDERVAQFDEGVDIKGPVYVAASIEAEADAPTDGGQGRPPSASGSKKKTRVVIIGNSFLVTNQLILQPTASADFVVNSIRWLTQTEELAGLRPKPPDSRTMFMNTVQTNLVFYSSSIFLPLLVLVGGVVVWWNRR